MSDVRISLKWLGVSVIMTLNWCCYLSDGSCLYPGRQSNEFIKFSITTNLEQYPAHTTAKYICSTDSKKEVFKEATCHVNGTWTFASFRHVNCSQTPEVRCFRPAQDGIHSSLKTIIFGENCFKLHKGITDSTWKNLIYACNISLFELQPQFVQYLKASMCNVSLFKNDVPRRIFLSMKTTNFNVPSLPYSESSAIRYGTRLSGLTQQRSFLDCSSTNSQDAVVLDSFESISDYWICRHQISSCGSPSQEMYSTMNTSGRYVNSMASYNCQLGYETEDIRHRRCQEDGFWSGHPPLCKLKGSTKHELNANQVHSPSTEINENTSNSLNLKPGEEDLLTLIIGAIAGATLFLIVLMWLVMAVLLWRHKRKAVGVNKLLK